MRRVLRAWLRSGVLLLAALGSGMLVCRGADEKSATHWRVAMIDFTSDDGLMRSAAGAAQWSTLTQDALASPAPGLDWVERAQLHLAAEELGLSAGGLTTPDGSLRLGKWLKADAAILGRFTRNAREDGGHTLRLGVVDLDRADILAARTIQIDGDRRDAVTPDPKLVAATAAALREALAESREKLARGAHQKVIAPLFFHNADPSPRLNGFGADLLESFTRAAGEAADVRVLRFQGADDARDEADLAVRGLSEVDADAWQHVADLYVWGSYRERPSPNTAFEQTPVEVELTWWDGVHSTGQRRETTTVAGLPALARQLAGECLEAARHAPATRPATGSVRDEIAARLREQGKQLEVTVRTHDSEREAFRASAEGRTLVQQERLVLAAACFFAPTDPTAELARLRTKWENFPSSFQRLPLLDLWRRSNDLAAYSGRLGGADVDLLRANADADAAMLYWLRYGEAYGHVAGNDPSVPLDATDADTAAWHKTLDARFARDVAAYVKLAAHLPLSKEAAVSESHTTWMHAALQLVQDPALAVQVAETVWPFHRDFYRAHHVQEDSRYGDGGGGLPASVQRLYARANHPDRAAAILDSLALGEIPSTATADAAAAKAATPAADVPRLIPVFRSLNLPTGEVPAGGAVYPARRDPRATVQTLAVGGDEVLWVSLLRRSEARGQTAQELWRFDPSDDSVTRLFTDELTAQTPITSILPQAGACWLTVGLSGVWQCEAETGRLTRRWTTADGLLTANVDAGAAVGDAMYFAGHENARALLNRFDPKRGAWMRVDLPGTAAAPIPVADSPVAAAPGVPPTAQTAAFGRWLLVQIGEDWTLVDTANQETKPLREVLPVAEHRGGDPSGVSATAPPFRGGRLPMPAPRLLTADAHGFWVVLDGRIYQFDPAQPRAARSWPVPWKLAGGVWTLASDGDDLWLAGRSVEKKVLGPPQTGEAELGFVAVLHEADGRWRGGFDVPGPVGCLGMSRQAVYMDLQMIAQPLFEIEKTATLSGPAH